MSIFGVPIHFLLVHFPVGLAVVAAFMDFRGMRTGRPELHDTGYRLTIGAAATAVLAVITGMQRLNGRTNNPSAAIHAAAALVTLLVWVVLAGLRYSANARPQEGADAHESFSGLWMALEIFGVIAAVAAAITGHRFVLGL